MFVHPELLSAEKRKVEFEKHELLKKEDPLSYCNMCLKKGVSWICVRREHARIHKLGFHLCQKCYDKHVADA